MSLIPDFHAPGECREISTFPRTFLCHDVLLLKLFLCVCIYRVVNIHVKLNPV